MLPFPAESHMRWRRLDVPGHEHSRIVQIDTGWQLSGTVAAEEDGVTAEVSYLIVCGHDWRTISAQIEANANGSPLHFALDRNARGEWHRDGNRLPELDDAIDIDLGFTPATNTLPIRRLALEVGASAPVQSAWLRFPEFRLEVLHQTYTRESARVFRYEAQVDNEPFTARLDVDAYGRVLDYEGLWTVDTAKPAT